MQQIEDNIRSVIDDLQAHLQTAEVVELRAGESYRMPVGAITCRDGTQFSVQASRFTYCTPRNDQGPWTAVEVMTLTEGVTPRNWEHDAGDNLAGYVPIEAVAREILDRGYLTLESSYV
jgi:hypothetical protein